MAVSGFSVVDRTSRLSIISSLLPSPFGCAMHAPVYITPPMLLPPPEPAASTRELADLLRQMVGLQQEQIGLLKAQVANQDNGAKWRSFLSRWENEFPQIGIACKQALPMLERAYLGLIRELTERVNAAEAAEL